MKKKVAIRKLNRTLLKKEGTKELYITGKTVLMSFFEYEDISELATSRRDERAKRLFFFKRNVEEKTTLAVTKENNEVRLTGFERFFEDNDIKEVDQIVLERIDADQSTRFMLDYIKCPNIRVFQKYETKDNCENYAINRNNRGIIQLSEKEGELVNYINSFWLWDDSFDDNRWAEIEGKEFEAVFVYNGSVQKKNIRIQKTGEKYKKILKAITNSNNQLEYQEKELYEIMERKGEEWIPADFGGLRNLELVDEGWRIKIISRDAQTFCISEGGTLK